MSNINYKRNIFGPYYVLEYQLNNEYPLEEYLKNDDAILCSKYMSDKLKKYFKSEKIKQLIKFIIEEPEEDDQLRGHKYPYVASEILKSDIPYILKRFVLNEKEYYKEYKEILDANDEDDDDDSSSSSSEEEKENPNEDKNGIINKKDDEQNNNNEINKDINEEKKINENENNTEEKNDKNIEKNNDNNKLNNINNNNDKNDNKKIIDDNENKDKNNEIENIGEKEIKKEENNNNIDNDKKEEDKQSQNEEIKNIQTKEEMNEKETNLNISNKEAGIKVDELDDIEIKNNSTNDLNENKKIEEEKEEKEHKEKCIDNDIEMVDEVDSVSFGSDKQVQDNENQNNEFFDLLLTFVMNDKPELNYVLSGYFANVISTLLDTYPSKVFHYLYTVRKDALKKIVFRSHQKVFSIISSKLLNIENNEKLKESKDTLENYKMFRNELIHDIIKTISLDGFKDENNNFYNNIDIEAKITFIGNIINDNKYVLEYILENNDLYGYIFTILDIYLYEEKNCDNNFDNKYYIYGLLIDLFSKILKCSYSENLKCPKEFNNVEKEKTQLTFSEYAIITFGNIIKNNFIPKKPKLIIGAGTFLAYEGLGILIIKILQLVKEMFFFMKEIPNTFDLILLNNDFCIRSLDYFFKYQMNNIYHIKFIELLDVYLKEEMKHTELTKFFFEQYKLHEVLINYLKGKDDKQKLYFEFKTGKKIKSGIYPHIINIIYKLHIIAGLSIFTEEEIKTYKISKIGEFEFLKNENPNKLGENIDKDNINKDIDKDKDKNKDIVTSKNIGIILKESKEWNEAINTIVSPLIKKYEGKLCKEEAKDKNKEKNSNNNDTGIDLLIDYINKGRSIKDEKSMEKIRRKIMMTESTRNKRKKAYRSIQNELDDDNSTSSENNNENNDKEKSTNENNENKEKDKNINENDGKIENNSKENNNNKNINNNDNKDNEKIIRDVNNTMPEEVRKEDNNVNNNKSEVDNKNEIKEISLLSDAKNTEQKQKKKNLIEIIAHEIRKIHNKAEDESCDDAENESKNEKEEEIGDKQNDKDDKDKELEKKEDCGK